MIRKGEEWGSATTEPPDLEVWGSDAQLAEALAAWGIAAGTAHEPGPLVRFRPMGSSDLARAVGLASGGGTAAVPLDVLRLPDGRLAVNSILLGAPPSRLRPWHARRAVEVACDGRPGAGRAATSVAVLTGQYVGGLDLNPRSHPGDGSVEVQVYGLPAGERRAMRRRLPSGSHLPHPGITTARAARRVWVRFDRDVAVELDGVPAGRAATLDIEVLAGAFRLVV